VPLNSSCAGGTLRRLSSKRPDDFRLAPLCALRNLRVGVSSEITPKLGGVLRRSPRI